MTTLIVCAIVIALICVISEFRVLKIEKDNKILREELIKSVKVGRDLADDYMVVCEILVDHFGKEKVNAMYKEKKLSRDRKYKEPNDFIEDFAEVTENGK